MEYFLNLRVCIKTTDDMRAIKLGEAIEKKAENLSETIVYVEITLLENRETGKIVYELE